MRTCKRCCFYEQCGQRKTCEYYSPVDDTEETKEDRIENRKELLKFREEWAAYVKEDSGDFSYIDEDN